MPNPTTVQWSAKTLGEVTKRLVNGGTPPTDVIAYWNGDIPWITGADFTQSGVGEFRRFVSLNAVRNTSTNVISQGELLIVTRTGVGKLAITPCDVAISQDITGVYPDREQVDVEFLYHRMRQGVEDLKKLNQGTSINGIIRKDLIGYSIVLPPLSQQQRIAKILSTVDEAIEQTEALIAKTQQIKAGLMHDLFTRGITPDGQLRPPREEAPHLYKESPLGWIPKEWDFDHLSELTTRIVDGVHHTPSYVEHGVPFVTVKNLTFSRTIDFSDLNYISPRDHQEFIRRADPKLGDVLVTKDGTLGVSRLVEGWYPEFSIFVSVALLRPIVSRLRPQMLHMFFDCGAYERQLGHLSAGTGLKHIHLEHFRRFVIPLPDGDEQDRIACIASAIERRLMDEEVGVENLQRLKRGLMHDLLTGRVRVNVSEPASA